MKLHDPTCGSSGIGWTNCGWIGVSFVALALLAAGNAQAQTRDRDQQFDLRRDREAIIEAAPEAEQRQPGPRRDFEIDLTAPVLYTTNPLLANTDTSRGAGPDWHFNPDLLLRWSHQYPSLKLSAAFDISVDRFFSQSSADEDSTFASIKLALGDGKSEGFVPYVSYTGIVDFQPDFHTRDDTLHDFALGFSSAIGLGSDGRVIQYRNATDPGATSFSIDLRGGRRLADPRDFENTFLVVALDVYYVLTNEWALGLTPKLRVRWYDNFGGEFRRDYKPSTVLKAAWTPDWLTTRVRGAEIDFTASFNKNYSTRESARFTEWEVGPTVALSWRF